jgi:hypothetical protein
MIQRLQALFGARPAVINGAASKPPKRLALTGAAALRTRGLAKRQSLVDQRPDRRAPARHPTAVLDPPLSVDPLQLSLREPQEQRDQRRSEKLSLKRKPRTPRPAIKLA